MGDTNCSRQISIQLTPPHINKTSNEMIWPLSRSSLQRIRCSIVEDLKKLGYLVTDGTKFGGEYVAYPGDPKLYHAQFVIRTLYTEQSITPCFLTAQTRVSAATRKHLVLASVQEKIIKKRHKKQNNKEKNEDSDILTKDKFTNKLHSNERIVIYG